MRCCHQVDEVGADVEGHVGEDEQRGEDSGADRNLIDVLTFVLDLGKTCVEPLTQNFGLLA